MADEQLEAEGILEESAAVAMTRVRGSVSVRDEGIIASFKLVLNRQNTLSSLLEDKRKRLQVCVNGASGPNTYVQGHVNMFFDGSIVSRFYKTRLDMHSLANSDFHRDQ